MARKVFFSFHYKPDNWRASQVRNIGAVEGNTPLLDNEWEAVTRGGDEAIQRWIDDQLRGKACTIVLIGTHTAGRKWIEYEIKESWDGGKGLVGIHIHRLKNKDGEQSVIGSNPFDGFTIGSGTTNLSSIVKNYDPPFTLSKDVYEFIGNNLEDWVEEAMAIRAKY